MRRIEGREFSEETLRRIQELVRQQPQLSRRQLSVQVCEWLQWRNRAGKLQEMGCRKALLQLHREGVIELPEITREYAFGKPSRAVSAPPVSPVEGQLGDLGKVELVRVAGRGLSPLWRGLMDAYHYLKSGPLCGAQIRYLVRSEAHGWVGALSYSACALRVECRDKWIGWSEGARRQNLNLVVNNSRFLIAPMVRVKDLASHVLALGSARLGDDWEALYGYRPVLLETYVQRGRFQGSCYAGAGWALAGTTAGRGRQKEKTTIKDVYLKPLCETWRRRLCTLSGQAPVVALEDEQRGPRDWIEEELGHARLGDRRLTARLMQMTGQFYEQPMANIPQSCGSIKAAKAAYRFLDNADVQWEAIIQAHVEATTERLHDEAIVLAATDSTTLNYSSRPATEGLGFICEKEKALGIIVHDTLCFTVDGTPLGLLDVQCWSRQSTGNRQQRHSKPIEEKESFKWIKSYRAVSAIQKQSKTTRFVVIGDREADIHELFNERALHKRNADLLIRAERSRNRLVSTEEDTHAQLWQALLAKPVSATRKILIPPGENRPARQVELDVRFAEVTICAPRKKPHLPAFTAWAVHACEAHPPQDTEALEWMLLTTVQTTTPCQALQRLEWYAKRWGIEVFHRILKSGCRIESRQLASVHRLCNCLAIDMVIAWRIFHLTLQGRQAPDLPCGIYFSPDEWKALTTFVLKSKLPPSQPPSLNEAVAMLGRLGGHLGRAGDAPPGSEVLWRGMTRLADISEAYRLYH